MKPEDMADYAELLRSERCPHRQAAGEMIPKYIHAKKQWNRWRHIPAAERRHPTPKEKRWIKYWLDKQNFYDAMIALMEANYDSTTNKETTK